MAFFDHLETPGMPSTPVWEAMGIAGWVAAKTERIKVGHLVQCDAHRTAQLDRDLGLVKKYWGLGGLTDRTP